MGMNMFRLSPYSDKYRHLSYELKAMQTLKMKVSEAESNPTPNFLMILTESFHSNDIDPNPSAYSFLLKYLSRRSLFSQIHPILDHLERVESFEVPESIFVNLIKCYGRAGSLQDAINIFYRIPKFRCTPSAVSLNPLLSLLCKKKKGLLLVQDVLMNTPGMRIRLEASTFHILIRVLCKMGKVSSAVELLNLMQLDGCVPNSKMDAEVLHLLCKHGTASEVMSFLEVIQKTGFSPQTADYNRVIDSLVREGKARDAFLILVKMKSEEGKRPDIWCYNSVLHGFLLANDLLKVEDLFDEILLIGLVPNISTYNTYIDGLCRQRDFSRAHRMIVCMENAGCKADATTFNVLVAGYAKAGETGRAREMMNEMLQKGFQWNICTCCSVIDGLIRKDEIGGAHDLLREMLEKGYVPCALTFNSLASNLCKKDHHSEALQVLDEMLNRYICPDASLWEALIVGCRTNQQRTPVELDMIMSD